MDARRHVWRSRWAAVGAAVAVTLGAGGLYSVNATSTASPFVAITPTRVLDTRINAGLAGKFTSATPRLLDVTGTVVIVQPGDVIASGAPVPDGATAIVANVTAVRPTTEGFVSVRPGNITGNPTTSNINTSPGAILPNSVTVELPTTGPNTGQIQLWFQGTTPTATTDLLVDIVGYYAPGPQGPAGPRGFSAWDTIPSGVTVTGVEYYDGHQPTVAGTGTDGFTVQLPGIAPKPLTGTTVNFAGGSGAADQDPACTGTFTNPTAPLGKVCIYLAAIGGLSIATATALESYLPTRAFYITFSPTATSGADEYLFITWAYTAPNPT